MLLLKRALCALEHDVVRARGACVFSFGQRLECGHGLVLLAWGVLAERLNTRILFGFKLVLRDRAF
eukprot:15461659-Alexandrium_andersonii.AAC.1